MSRCFWLLVAVAAALIVTAAPVRIAAQQGARQQPAPSPAGGPALSAVEGLQFLPVRGNIYVLQGAGANITVSIGRDGVLMVDTGTEQNADRVLAAIQQLQRRVDDRLEVFERIGPQWAAETRLSALLERDPNAPVKPIRYIINTHVHPDHVGGNLKLRMAGRTFTGGNVAGQIADAIRNNAQETLLKALRFASNGDLVDPQIWIYQVVNGEFQQVQ